MIEFLTSPVLRAVVSALNRGFLTTVQLFCVTLIGALPLGLLICFGSMSRLAPLARPVRWFLRRRGRPGGRLAGALIAFRPVRLGCRLLVWGIRGTPLVLQLTALFYVPGIERWFQWPPRSGRMIAACAAFILNYACYFSEIYRGGIQSVPPGQREAGAVLGMTRGQIFRHVTLPQMVRAVVPPMSNEIITLVKDTSLARVISLQEVIWAGESFLKGNATGFAGLTWPLFFTAVYYLLFNGAVTVLLGRLERKLRCFQ